MYAVPPKKYCTASLSGPHRRYACGGDNAEAPHNSRDGKTSNLMMCVPVEETRRLDGGAMSRHDLGRDLRVNRSGARRVVLAENVPPHTSVITAHAVLIACSFRDLIAATVVGPLFKKFTQHNFCGSRWVGTVRVEVLRAHHVIGVRFDCAGLCRMASS